MTCIIFAGHPDNKGDVQQKHVTFVHVTIGHFYIVNYLFNLNLVYHAIYISVWCFIFDKMVASKCFLWSSTFTWSNSVRIDIRWDEGWRDEMTTTYTYKLTSIEICIYFDIDLLTCFMQFMAALRGLSLSNAGRSGKRG